MDSPHIHVIACAVLAADLKAAAGELGLTISTQFLPGGLHETPQELRRRLQAAIDEVSSDKGIQRIAIGYGVCGMGTCGLHARDIPLAIPKVHDCIALFLGSDHAYREQFRKCPGTYYISAGWVDEKVLPDSMKQTDPLQCGPRILHLDEIVEKYGAENADAIRHFLNSWQRNYRRAAFIETGVGGHRRKYAEIARNMAREFGWTYEELVGTHRLLNRLLLDETSNDEVLIVPPHHETVYNGVMETLQAVSPVGTGLALPECLLSLSASAEKEQRAEASSAITLGLGIDAGGTYTDAVIYSFESNQVLEKAKAPTAKWDFTVGIREALSKLNATRLPQVNLVSLSTTLATNAIVEGRGQKVGLLIMPPYGLFDPSDIPHRPISIIDGRMDFDGTEISPVNPDQVREVIRRMIEQDHVRAFAVAGFAADSNPAHELLVKSIIREETGMSVTCGNDVSDLMNYRVRAQTAALNARIIPLLEALIDQVQIALRYYSISAPMMVVRSDGSLMSARAARQRPIDTVLSGPAASVAGARFLSRLDRATVVDIGGTTTDIAIIRNGIVETSKKGATIGGWRTHVKALDMRTFGLGGDSLIGYHRQHIQIGPRRVTPICRLGEQDTNKALEWIEQHLDSFDRSTDRLGILALNAHKPDFQLTEVEMRIFDILSERPYSIQELSSRLTGDLFRPVPLERLQERYAIQRCGLTPTDLLHIDEKMHLWNRSAAVRFCEIHCRLAQIDLRDFVHSVLEQFINKLTMEILKREMAGTCDAEDMDKSLSAAALLQNMMRGGDSDYQVRIRLKHPLIGIGAPVHHFLPQVARLLETEAIIPPDADVANAIGAITSFVLVQKHVRISPTPNGTYNLYGLVDSPVFSDFEEAQAYAVRSLRDVILRSAGEAGTSESRIEVTAQDQVAPLADGGQQFLGRTITARLTGRPDLVRLLSDTCDESPLLPAVADAPLRR
ncbi:MAG TPA: DUF1638 domain-containing protein [bacterium]|nr:DUF1638 domain-containing protein [bacterium]HQL61810.1 DUF1638 domain-containing protein [bacterium]